MAISSAQISRQAHRLARRVLLVEDNAGDAELASERLAEANSTTFEVTCAASLTEAGSLFDSRFVDAIILDLNLPDSRGLETIQRAREFGGSTPIIAVSGAVDDELRLQARDLGAEEMFDKNECNSRLFWRSVLQIIERRREQQRQFQVLLDATPDAILLVNHAGTVRYVNEAAVNLFGRSRDELEHEPLGFSVLDALPSEITILRHGEERICEMRVVQMEWDDERSYLASIRDITVRKRAEALEVQSRELKLQYARLEASHRLKSLFVANMSHELRTPLNAIIGFAQLLRDDYVDTASPDYKVFVGHILKSGQDLLRMISDILDLSKLESGKFRFQAEPVDLCALTRSIIDTLVGITAQRRCTIRLHVDPGLPRVRLDPARFKQVLYNYLSNALKFSHDGGEIEVRLAFEGEDCFRLSVRDNGAGIDPEDIGKLFVEFQQLDSGAAKRHQGTGLGLALTRHLVEAQGGRVGVDSAPGEGAEFYAVLPLVRTSGREE
ncbi:MAG TPA: ATP-binding protein [Rubrivivax sp.]|jgi:signal transduction histidine kinase|nr:ATP-binding protein [Rubrivivax sp.]